jgi:hypothetical protein
VRIALAGGTPGVPEYSEELILALNSGAVAVFPGQVVSSRPRALIVSPYLAFPLSDDGVSQMYNLMRRTAVDFDPVVVAFTKRLATPPPEILAISVEVVLVLEEPACTKPCASGGRPWRTSRPRKWRSTPPIARRPASSWWIPALPRNLNVFAYIIQEEAFVCSAVLQVLLVLIARKCWKRDGLGKKGQN